MNMFILFLAHKKSFNSWPFCSPPSPPCMRSKILSTAVHRPARSQRHCSAPSTAMGGRSAARRTSSRRPRALRHAAPRGEDGHIHAASVTKRHANDGTKPGLDPWKKWIQHDWCEESLWTHKSWKMDETSRHTRQKLFAGIFNCPNA